MTEKCKNNNPSNDKIYHKNNTRILTASNQFSEFLEGLSFWKPLKIKDGINRAVIWERIDFKYISAFLFEFIFDVS